MELLLRVYRDDGLWKKIDIISGVLCHKQVWRAGTSDYIPEYLWEVFIDIEFIGYYND